MKLYTIDLYIMTQYLGIVMIYDYIYIKLHTMEYYSAIKNEIMPFAVIWMDLEIIILIEVSQKRKTNTI